MTDYFEEEIKRVAAILTDCGTIAVLNVPNLPANVNDPNYTPTLIGYQGLLEDMEPKKQTCNEALRDYRETIKEWKTHISKLTGTDKTEHQTAYADVLKTTTLGALFSTVQAKDRELGTAIVDARKKAKLFSQPPDYNLFLLQLHLLLHLQQSPPN